MRLFGDLAGTLRNAFKIGRSTVDASGVTVARTHSLPNKSGTVALIDDPAEWSAETVSQEEAEDGSSNTRRAWTSQRVREAIAAWWASIGRVNPVLIGTAKTEFLTAGDGITRNANSISGDAEHWVEITNNPSSGAGKQLFRMNSYGQTSFGNNIHFCRYFGTEASPTAISAGAFLFSAGFRGWDGSALSQSAGAFQAQTTEAWTSSAHGMKFIFQTTPNGSLSRSTRMEIDGSGVAVTGTLTVNGVDVGYKNIPQNSRSANYTLVLADAGCHIYHPSTDNTARAFTIPSNASVPYPIGTALTFINDINAVTISINSDTMVLAGSGATGNRTLAAQGVATAIKVTSTRWIISGVGLT